jgi:two-component system, LytTR family, response regulator
MTTCIIIEDDKLAREALIRLLEINFSSEIKLLGTAETLKGGIELIHQKAPDIVMLDIELPDENGFRLFDYFSKISFDVIFTTAYQHYALSAIKYSAIDYLIKPVSLIDMKAALIRFEKKNEKRISHQQVKLLLESLKMGKSFHQKVSLPTADGFQVICIHEILYCLASENYTHVFTIDNEDFLVTRTLKAIEELLPVDTFFRIHKSTLLNLNYVKSFSRKDGCVVTLENGQKFEVATRRQEEFTNMFLKKGPPIQVIEPGNLFTN